MADEVKAERKPEPRPRLRFPQFQEAVDWKEYSGDRLFDQINDRNPEPGLPVLAITQEHGAIPRDMIDYHVSVTDKSIEQRRVKAAQIIGMAISYGGVALVFGHEMSVLGADAAWGALLVFLSAISYEFKLQVHQLR